MLFCTPLLLSYEIKESYIGRTRQDKKRLKVWDSYSYVLGLLDHIKFSCLAGKVEGKVYMNVKVKV